jgi:opacity protein-like surface antigen
MNMKSYLIGISVTGAIAFMPFSVLADWKEGWTGDVRYKYVVSSDANGSDTDTSSNQLVTFNGDAVDGESGFGFAIGKKIDNIGISLAYERMGVTADLTGSIQADGDLQLDTKSDFDIDTWMLEVDYTIAINDSFSGNLLAGIGQSTFDFSANSTRILRADGSVLNVGDTSDNTETTIRLGAGVGYKLSDRATLLTMLQYTDYGTADLKIDNGAITTGLDVETTELSVRVKFNF